MFQHKYYIFILATFMIYLQTERNQFVMTINSHNGTKVLESMGKDSHKKIEQESVKRKFDVISMFNSMCLDNSSVPHLEREKRFIENFSKGITCNQRRDFQKRHCVTSREAACDENKRLDVPNCYCDKECAKMKDCCYGFNKSNIVNETSNIKIYRDYLECRVDIIPGLYLHSIRGYWMVARCPATYINQTVSARCSARSKENIPVTCERGVVFWNMFCALCHGILNFEPWNVKLEVNHRHCYRVFPKEPLLSEDLLTLSVLKELRQKSCTFTYLPPKGEKPRTCYKSFTTTEPETACKNCQSHLRPVFIDHKEFYRNVFCVENDRWRNVKHMVCIEEGYPYHSKSHIYELSILFAVRKPRLDLPNLCGKNHQLDLATAICLPTDCEIEPCKSSIDDSVIQNYVLYMHLYLVSGSTIDENDSKQVLSMFTTCLPIEQYKLTYKLKSSLATIALLTLQDNLQSNTRSVINATFAYIVRKPLPKNALFKLKSKIQQMEWKYDMKFTWQSREKEYKIWRVWNLSESVDNYTDLTGWNFTRFSWGGFSTTYNYLDKLENQKYLPKLADIPEMCHVYISSITNDNQTRYEKPRFVALINYTMHTVKNSSERKPPPVLKSNTNFDNGQFIRGLLTYITLSVSCGAIAPTILIHRYLNLVSSIPGLISEQILIILFLFNICFMCGFLVSEYQTICFILALTTHFLLLSFFTWVSIFVCHTLHNLRTIKKAKRNLFKRKSFPKAYILVGYSIPCGFVIPSAILEVCGCTNIEIGFTKSVCFPTGYPANLVIVVIPVLLYLFMQVIWLTYSALCLHRVRKELPESSVSKSRSYLIIYIRLCLISCLSWGFGVLSEAFDNNVMRYFFIIISGLHGVIFTLCIVTTNSFRESFKNKMFSSANPEQIDMNITSNDDSQYSGNNTVHA